MSSIINATTTNGLKLQPDNSGSLVLQTNNGTTAVTVDTSQNTTLAGKLTTASSGIQFSDASIQTAAASPYVLKNRIINGDMRIDQRNAGASVTLTNTGVYTVDRWQGVEDTDGGMTAQQDSSAPAGFVNSLKCTTTTADGSLSATQYAVVLQKIEGTNISDLAWGTANARTVTLSFWVRSSLTGTFGGSLSNSANNRSYPFTYTISVADTWEQKSITIAGDTSGTWLTTTGVGINIHFGLGVGSTYSGTAGAWAGAQFLSATGATSVVGTNGATFYLTGVQLEVGTSATPFERRMYGQELALCQRYFEKSYNQDTAIAAATQTGMILMPNVLNFSSKAYTQTIYYKVTKRTTPTVTPYAYNGTSGQWNTGVIGVNEQLGTANLDLSSESKVGLAVAYTVTPNCAYGHFTASAEL